MANEPELLESRPPLNYADPALNRQDRIDRSISREVLHMRWRRLGFGFGLALILLGFGMGAYPQTGEAHFWLAAGGFIFGLAIPSLCPKRDAEG